MFSSQASSRCYCSSIAAASQRVAPSITFLEVRAYADGTTRALAAPLPGYRGTPYLSILKRPQLYLVQSTGLREYDTVLVLTLHVPIPSMSLLGRHLRHYHCRLGQWSTWRNSLQLLLTLGNAGPLEISLLQSRDQPLRIPPS